MIKAVEQYGIKFSLQLPYLGRNCRLRIAQFFGRCGKAGVLAYRNKRFQHIRIHCSLSLLPVYERFFR